MTTKSTITEEEVQIRQLIADQQRAICTKNVDQIMSRYATEVNDIPNFLTFARGLMFN